jgi:hypothetical protein
VRKRWCLSFDSSGLTLEKAGRSVADQPLDVTATRPLAFW